MNAHVISTQLFTYTNIASRNIQYKAESNRIVKTASDIELSLLLSRS